MSECPWKPFLFTRMKDFDKRPDGTLRRRGEGGYRACIKVGPFIDDILPIGTAGDMMPKHRPYVTGAPKGLVIDQEHVFIGETGSLHLRLGEGFPYARDTADRGIGYTFGFVAPVGTKIPTIEAFQSFDAELRKELWRLVIEANEGRFPLESDLGHRIAELAESRGTFDAQHEWNRIAAAEGSPPQRALAFDFKDIGAERETLAREAARAVFTPDHEFSPSGAKKKALPTRTVFKDSIAMTSSWKVSCGAVMACVAGWAIYESFRRKRTPKTEQLSSSYSTGL